MSFDGAGLNGLDYDVCEYDGSRLMFRGPKIDVDKPYVAFLGATEIFDKFVAQPFPTVLTKHLPAQSLNLGMINAGVDAYLGDPAIVDLAKKADLRVVQVLSALNQSNHFFKVHPRRNDRFIGASEALVRMYPEVDFTEFHFTKAMLVALHDCSERRFKILCFELQQIWLKRMSQLLKYIGSPTVLVWFAGAEPPKNGLRDPKDPMLVDAKMIEKIRGEASAYVLCVPDETALAQDNEELLRIMASPVAASQIMGPKAHLQAAQTLQEICTDLMRK